MGYNLTWSSSANTLWDLTTNVNTMSGGWLFTVLLVALFVVILLVFSHQDMRKVLPGASLICLLLGGLMWTGGLIPMSHLGVGVLILIISVVYSIWGE